MNPRVDIALATYNGEQFLPELLESILQQTHTNWHLTAGDDRSTDRTPELLQQAAREHPERITLLPSVPHQLGIRENFSRVFRACRADYLLPADQDDLWLPNKIECLLESIRTVEEKQGMGVPGLIHSDLLVVDEQNTQISPSFWNYQHLSPRYGVSFKNSMIQNTVTGCACILNRALLDKALPIPPQAVMHDWWFALTATAFGTLDFISTPTIRYRQHEHNDTGAKAWSPQHIVAELKTGRASLRERIRQTQHQAAAFRKQYEADLDPKQKDLLLSYSALRTASALKKRLGAAKHHLHKHGALRTLGFYWAL